MSKDVDMTDDWMNPPSSVGWSITEPENKMEYIIERERRLICFGNPGHIGQWGHWATFDTAEERDAELKKLREEHPVWHLRARDRNPWQEFHYGRVWSYG